MSNGWFTALPLVGKLFSESRDLIDQAVPDGDMRAKLIGNLEELKRQADYELRIKELETTTVPWVDALHKVGRQLLNLVSVIAVVVLMLNDVEITGAAALVLGGPNAVYQAVKGKGR